MWTSGVDSCLLARILDFKFIQFHRPFFTFRSHFADHTAPKKNWNDLPVFRETIYGCFTGKRKQICIWIGCLALGSGPRYIIRVTRFCTSLHCARKRVQFLHVCVFSDSPNVQKRATKSETLGHCLVGIGNPGCIQIFVYSVQFHTSIIRAVWYSKLYCISPLLTIFCILYCLVNGGLFCCRSSKTRLSDFHYALFLLGDDTLLWTWNSTLLACIACQWGILTSIWIRINRFLLICISGHLSCFF